MKIEYNTQQLAVLIKTYYEYGKEIEPTFLPDEIYLLIAETLEKEIPDFTGTGIDFFVWCNKILLIYPKEGISKEDMEIIGDNKLWVEYNGIVGTGYLGDLNEEAKKQCQMEECCCYAQEKQ